MEFTQQNKERLAMLTNLAIGAWHKQFKDNTREFMYHYAVDAKGTIYCIHHLPENYGGNTPLVVDIDMMSRDLALLSYFLQDIINQKYFR